MKQLTVRSSFPEYKSPVRHHVRTTPLKPRTVVETLNARSEYMNSETDEAFRHQINQFKIKMEIGRGSFGAVHLAVDQYDNEYVSISAVACPDLQTKSV